MSKIKTARQMERHIKGIANHYRIKILLLIDKNKNITLDGIISSLKANDKTIGEHTRRLSQAGLVNKKYNGHNVLHSLSPYGEKFVDFLKSLQNLS